MALSNISFNTLITCGIRSSSTRIFNEQTDIKQIHEHVCHSFASNLPKSYKLVYYDPITLSFIDLKSELHNGGNPFQRNPSIGVQTIDSMPSSIHLFVVQDSSISSDMPSEFETESAQGVFGESSSHSSENSIDTNDNVSSDQNEQVDELLQTFIEPSSNRLSFSRDVKSHQKDIYKSDQFNIRQDKNSGHIARVQGVKTSDENRLSVLPKVRIPSIYHQENMTLLVTVVSEQFDHGIRVWYKHNHKGFLSENYDKDTQTLNPIEFNINERSLTDNGDFILNLHMITKWNKEQRSDEAFYRLDEIRTLQLHPAVHDSSSPRLICVLRQNDQIIWNTACLSDFIRSPRLAKRKSIDQVCSSNETVCEDQRAGH